jgi:hypothetical protein
VPTATDTPLASPTPTSPPTVPRVERLYLPVVQSSVPGPTPPAMPTATVVAPVQNGDFSNGLANWIATDGGLGVSAVLSGPIAGPAALLGNPNRGSCGGLPVDGFGQIAQRVTLPNSDRVLLRFDWVLRTRDVAMTFETMRPVDTFDVYVVAAGDSPPSGELSAPDRVFRTGRTATQPDYPCDGPEVELRGSEELDISARKGQVVWLIFQTWNRIDDLLNTYTYVDNIKVE